MAEDICCNFGHRKELGIIQFKWIPAMASALSKNYQSMHVHMRSVSVDCEDTDMVLRTTESIKNIVRNAKRIFMNGGISPRYPKAV